MAHRPASCAGAASSISILKQHPLARAIRADKTCLAALSATLNHYLFEEALQQIPVWQMISRTEKELEREALTWAAQLAQAGIPVQIMDGRSRVGGGSLPGSTLPTTLVAIVDEDATALAARLRLADEPVVGRIQEDRLLLDPRTVLPQQTETLLRTVKKEFSQNE